MRCPVCEWDCPVYESGPNNALYIAAHGSKEATCSGSGYPVNRRWHK